MISVNFKLSPLLAERYPDLIPGEEARFEIITRQEYELMPPLDKVGRLFIVVNHLITDVYCETELRDKELKQYVIRTERELICRFTD